MNILAVALVAAAAVPSVAATGAGEAADSVGLGEVVVTGTRGATDIRHLPMAVSVVGRQKLTENYRTQVLPTVSEQVPGLFVTSRGVLGYGVSNGSAGSIKVRGVGSGASLLVLVDGVPQYAGLMGHPIPDAYQTMLADRVEVVRGPASLLYGSNAMGGVVNIVTRQLRSDGSKTAATLQGGSYGTIEGALTNTTRKGKAESVIGFNYSHTDGHRADSRFSQYSGFAKLGYSFSAHWRATGDISLTHFEAENPGEVHSPLTDNDSRITRGMASVALSNRYGRTEGAVRAFYNWGHHEINDGYGPGEQPQQALYMHDDLMGGVSVYQSATLFSGNRLTLGFDWQHFGGRAWNEAVDTKAESVIGDREQDVLAGYAELRQDLAPWLTIDAGLRVDHHSQAGTELVPQGGVTLRLSPASDLKAMVSKGFRNPTIREMYMFPPANDQLEPERLVNYELAYTQRLLQNRLRLGANVFYMKVENLIETVRTDGRPRNVNTGKMENWGFELEAACDLTESLKVNANYSFLDMNHPVVAAPEHKLYLGANYSVGRFAFATGLQYVGGLYTATEAANGVDETEDFWLWNLTATCRVAHGVSVFARGENLLAQRYEVNYGYPMPRATAMAGVSVEF